MQSEGRDYDGGNKRCHQGGHKIQPSYGKPTSLTAYAQTVNHSLKKMHKLAYNLIQLFRL